MDAMLKPGNEPPQEALIAQLMSEVATYLPKDQVEGIQEACNVASLAHSGQYRISGEDYVCHPISVALILSDKKLDAECVKAALLHDILEDTDVSYAELAEQFGEDVAHLVEGVSKLTKINFKSRQEAQAENMRKMFLAMAKDLRVIIIKLADRLHNMRTIGVMKPASRRRIAKETLDIYAPVANRLGMHDCCVELEDLSFGAIFPRRKNILLKSVKSVRGNRKEVIDKISSTLNERFKDSSFPATISGREKNLYSIYRKMRIQKIHFSEVLDVYAFRVIVESVEQCYQSLGVLHALYKPMPGRFKDYIAIPKSNGYQSLHTVLIGPFGVPIELQIRTKLMDKVALSGIAAHWLYKTDGVASPAKVRAHEWLKGLLDLEQANEDSFEFFENLKIDLFPQEIFVFSPKGKILKLPKGSTAVDFAFAVHTDIGMTCAGAKINRKMEPLHTLLKNGQTVEIMTSDFAVCNPNWLNFVVTSKARSAIRHYLKDFKERDAITLGGQLLNAELKAMNLSFKDVDKGNLDTFLDNQQLSSLDALLMDMGFGNRLPLMVAQQLIRGEDLGNALNIATDERSTAALNISGAEGLLVTLASCCKPIYGDKVIGFFNPGRGVAVHRIHCKNTKEYKRKGKNWLNVQWADQAEGEFSTDVRIEIKDERGVLGQIASLMSSFDCNIEDIKMSSRAIKTSSDVFTITVRDRKHLARLMRRLRLLPSIVKIERVRN